MTKRFAGPDSKVQATDEMRFGKTAALDQPATRHLAFTDRSSPVSAASVSQTVNDFATLKRLLMQRGLLEKQPRYYAVKMLLTFSLLMLSLTFLILVHQSWLQLLNAAFLAFVSTQLGLLGHDAGHRQLFRRTWKNDSVSLITGNFLLGMSHGWWIEKHNQHHSHPNQQDLDPDIDIPLLAFSSDHLPRSGKLRLFLVKYQATFFFPLLLLASVNLKLYSVLFLMQRKEKYHFVEVALLLGHYLAYLGLLFWCLPAWQAVLFIFIHQGLTGLYLGSIFAPNHKGMPILDQDSPLDFLHRQVETARNVKAHPFTDFWYGGLNYQIEHHLFPSMPRNNLREAQRIIKPFCQARALPYHETGWLQSYREILHHLHAVSAPLRVVSSR
jgi:fatty acid desaturase